MYDLNIVIIVIKQLNTSEFSFLFNFTQKGPDHTKFLRLPPKIRVFS